MIVRLVSGSHAHSAQLGEAFAVDLNAAVLRSRRAVLKNLSHVIEQPCCREQNVRQLLPLDAVHEKSRILMSLRLRFLKPVVGSVLVLWHAVAAEIEFSQQVLRVGIALLGSHAHIFRCAFRVFRCVLSAEIFLAQPVGGVVAAALRRPFQPIEPLRGILYFRIIREEQLAQCILRCCMILLRSQFQIVLCLFRIRNQQPAITIENPGQVLRVPIAAVCQRFQLLCGFIAILQRQGLVRRPPYHALTGYGIP